jgi:hypothetical protein
MAHHFPRAPAWSSTSLKGAGGSDFHRSVDKLLTSSRKSTSSPHSHAALHNLDILSSVHSLSASSSAQSSAIIQRKTSDQHLLVHCEGVLFLLFWRPRFFPTFGLTEGSAHGTLHGGRVLTSRIIE